MTERREGPPSLEEFIGREVQEAYGPLVADFTVDVIPKGAAPLEIKEQWVGVTIPLRRVLFEKGSQLAAYYRELGRNDVDNPNPVFVCGIDAIRALNEQGLQDAANYWKYHGFGGAGTLVFRAHEGNLVERPLE